MIIHQNFKNWDLEGSKTERNSRFLKIQQTELCFRFWNWTLHQTEPPPLTQLLLTIPNNNRPTLTNKICLPNIMYKFAAAALGQRLMDKEL